MSEPVQQAVDLEQLLGYSLATDSPDALARTQAVSGAPLQPTNPTSLLSYRSQGSLLIIGSGEHALQQARQLKDKLRCTVLMTGLGNAPEVRQTPCPSDKFEVVYGRILKLAGHLGQFKVDVELDGKTVNLAQTLDKNREHFDLVLDLGASPQLTHQTLPFGYYATGDQASELHRALAEIPELVGEFEKPKYFSYNADICAHGASGVSGCTRCLDACPTDAIRSVGEKIEVDPYLCQGGGSCATACPTGAIIYAYPSPSDLIAQVKALVQRYHEAGGSTPRLLFHDTEVGREWVSQVAAKLPSNVIPIVVEEVGSVGLDTWLAAIAYGVTQINVLCPPSVAAKVRTELVSQNEYVVALLQGLGYPEDLVQICAPDSPAKVLDCLDREPTPVTIEPATFVSFDEKRTTLRMALDHLYSHAPTPQTIVALPSGAPFGEIQVDKECCTLCMACVSVCPAAALSDGGDAPRLSLVEWNCVQCGICESACPEDAITRYPRMVFDTEIRRQSRVLNEEQPFQCISCGKAFATQSVMQRMQEKLKEHWMFQKPESLRRLQMCEDCRVKDMFVQEGGMVDTRRES